ncbi:putative MFS family transporter protein [Roseibium album]|nr:putative MFS family transporter protein [Roseibium album]
MSAPDRSPVSLALGGLFALAAAMGIGRFVYTPILPFMSESLQLSANAAGLIAAANFLGYLVGALAGAARSLPGKPRSWFLGGLLASALTSAAMAMTTDLWAFLAIRFFSGIASAFVLVFSTTLILERLNAAGRGGLSALHFAGVGCGIAFSALLIGGLDFLGTDWRGLWLASGAVTLVFLLISLRLVPLHTPQKSTHPADLPQQSASHGYVNGGLVRLVLAYGLFGFGYVITATFVSTIARTTTSLQPSEPFVWLSVGICAAPSIFLWNKAAGALGARRAFALACVLEALGVALTVISEEPGMFLLGAALLGITFMGITALGLMEARQQASVGGPAAIRQMLAILTASFGLGQVIGPWFAGRLHAVTGSFEAPSLAAAAALLVAAALVVR